MTTTEVLQIRPENLTSAAYVNQEVFESERRHVFRRGWSAAAFEHQLPEPGDALPVDVGGVPVLLWRSLNGGVCAFLNVCRHRGAKLVTVPSNLRSRVTCPYHAWTYDQTGRLCAAPFAEGNRSGEFARAEGCDLDLKPIACDSWLDTIFVNISGDAGPLDRHIAPLAEIWGRYRTDRMRRFHSEGGVIAANWKLAIEAAVDTYHEGFVHPSLAHRLTSEGVRPFSDLSGGAMFGMSWAGDNGLRPDFPLIPLTDQSNDADRKDTLCFLFPNAQFNLFGGLSVRTIWTPVTVNETRWESSWYLLDDWAVGDEHEAARESVLNSWRQIREEDRQIVERVHAGRLGGLDVCTNFAPFWEQTGQRFQRMWEQSMGKEWSV